MNFKPRGRLLPCRCARWAGIGLSTILFFTIFAGPTWGSLVLDLRFSSVAGDKVRDISGLSAGSTVTIQVWAIVTGTDTNLTNDGLSYALFGLLSTTTTPYVTGGINSGTLSAPFNATPPASLVGTFADQNADSRSDWRGATTSGSTSGWSRASAGMTTVIAAGGATGQPSAADPTHAWEFHIADAIVTLNSVTLPPSGTVNALAYTVQTPNTISFIKGRWQQDGAIATGPLPSFTAIDAAVIFTLTSPSGSSPPAPDIDANLGPTTFYVLRNAANVPFGLNAPIVNNGTGAGAYTASGTGIVVVQGNGSGTLPPGAVRNVNLGLQPSVYASYGTVSGSVLLSTPGDPDAPSTDKFDLLANVGEATTNGTSFGPSFRAFVFSGESYTGLSSRTHAGTENGAVVLGTEAKLLGGTNPNFSSAQTISMMWRARTLAEKTVGGISPPAPGAAWRMISDVVDLSGPNIFAAADPHEAYPYVLQLSYDATTLGAAKEQSAAQSKTLYLAWLNPHDVNTTADDQWERATLGNFHNAAGGSLDGFQGSWAAAGSPLTVGSWGVDVSTHTVWAVLDHASEFGVIALPEPSGIALFACGFVALAAAWRRRRAVGS